MFKLIVPLALALLSTAQRTTESEEASITDPATECTYYYYAPVASALASFPEVWTEAAILPNDTAAQDLWNSISGDIPTNIPAHTDAPEGNFSFTDYDASDPYCWWTYDQCTTPKLAGLPPDIASVPEPKTLGYGFDDGPNCSHNALYDFLAKNNQQATMFFIGSNVIDWPLEAQRAVSDGHEICVHTWSHPHMTTLESENAFAELYYSREAIKLVTGVTPKCWRPPYGDVDDRIRAIANALGLQSTLWKYDTDDGSESPDGDIAAQVNKNYQDFVNLANGGTFDQEGAILLMHEINGASMQQIIDWYPTLAKAFDHLVPVTVALNVTTPYLEENYTFPTFADYISSHPSVSGSSNASNASDSSASSSSSTGKTDTAKTSSDNKNGAVTLHELSLWSSIAIAALGIQFMSDLL